MNEVTLFAPAKINLVLEVGPCRDDGFHEVAGVMTPIPLYDIVVVRPASSTNVIMHGLDIPIEENLAFRAAKIFFDATGMEGARIEIFKAIPVGSGLGGGSSDAVAVLKGLDFLDGGGTSWDLMHEMAANLGSDCPFFLDPGTSVVEGRGTKIHPVIGAIMPPMIALVPVQGNAFGLGPLSTRAVYNEFDRLVSKNPAPVRKPSRSLTKRVGSSLTSQSEEVNMTRPCELGFNALEPAIISLMPDAVVLKTILRDFGAEKVWFSGAGASVVGLFNSRERARDAIAGLGTRLGAGVLTLLLA